jgi:hypothetical protein
MNSTNDASGNEVTVGGKRRRNNMTMRKRRNNMTMRRNNMYGGSDDSVMDASGNEMMSGGKRRRNNMTMRKNNMSMRRNNNMMGGKMPAVGTKAQVYHGTAKHTSGGLTKKDLMKTKKGRIVSKKKHAAGQKAIKKLKKMGYVAKKGTFKLFSKK